MVKSEFLAAESCVAILAGVLVACVNIGPRELNDPAFLDLHILQQSQDGGKLHRKSDTMNLLRILLNHLNLASEQQGDGSLPTDDFERLKRGI